PDARTSVYNESVRPDLCGYRWQYHCQLSGKQRDRFTDSVSRGPSIFVLEPPGALLFMRQRHSEYMPWAKTQSRARFNLATSGVGPFPLRELAFPLDQLEINGDSTYGYAPLQTAIASRYGVNPDCVVAAAGTSMANHLALAAMVDSGDEVLIEEPAYELIVASAKYLGADVKR